MTDKLRELLEDVQTVYEGKGMVVHPNSFDRLRMEVIKLDNINKQQSEQIEQMKCCENCVYRTVDLLTFKPVCDKRKLQIENPLTCKCDKWKLVN